ncbi:microtubule-actin cross-linking factor 1 isoform X15 [Tachysurus ichikawai]
MAGFIPGLLPTTHSQEKEFAKAYEDVLERYKGSLCPATESQHFWPHFLFGVHSPAARDRSSRKRNRSQSRTDFYSILLVSLLCDSLS